MPGLVGGGSTPHPGENSLAHRGVLFLDEFNQFSNIAIESLRQPLEDRKITLARVNHRMEYPASFMLVAAVNPCKCGNMGSIKNKYICSNKEILQYRSRLSGPIMDRIDLKVQRENISAEEMTSKSEAETSLSVRRRVEHVRKIQRQRYKDQNIYLNSELKFKQFEQFAPLDKAARRVLEQSMDKFNLSMRSVTGVIKTSRTIADLAGSEIINQEHLLEALGYRVVYLKRSFICYFVPDAMNSKSQQPRATDPAT